MNLKVRKILKTRENKVVLYFSQFNETIVARREGTGWDFPWGWSGLYLNDSKVIPASGSGQVFPGWRFEMAGRANKVYRARKEKSNYDVIKTQVKWEIRKTLRRKKEKQ